MTYPSGSRHLTPQCRRCGTCCKKGGPALHREDLDLTRCGVISFAQITTLRKAEMVCDNVTGRIVPLAKEMLKLRPVPGGRACLFLEPNGAACSIHEQRPLECQAMFCTDTSQIESIYRLGRLTRFDLVGKASALAEVISYHEEKCPVSRLAELAAPARENDPQALAELSDLIALDKTLREVFLERTEAEPEMEFLFGRPLSKVLEGFGLRLEETPDGACLKLI